MTNIKSNKKVLRISAAIMLVVTLISSLCMFNANATSGDKVTVTFDYCYDSTGNTIKFQKLTTNGDYTVGVQGEALCKIFADGKEAYCIEPGHSLYSGTSLTVDGSTVWKKLGSAKQKAINLALLYGKPGSEKSLSGTADQKWVATQLIVWEIVTDCRSTDNGFKCTNTKYIDGITAGDANPGVKKVYNEISNSLAQYSTVPSFAAAVSSKAKTYEMDYSNGKYTLTLNDDNKVLSKFDFKSTDGVSVSSSGNKLTLSSDKEIPSAVSFNSAKSMPSVGKATLIPYGDATYQDVITGVENDADPIRAYFKVKTSNGNLSIVKTSEDGKIENIEFTIKGNDFEKTVKTGSKGEISISDLTPGTYTVTEKTYSEYVTQKTQTVTVESGKTATVEFSNVLKKWNLTVTKVDSETKSAQGNATLSGAVYGVYNNGKLVDEYTTDEKGSFTTKSYTCGDNWTLKEISPSEGYLLDTNEHHIGAEPKNFTKPNNLISLEVKEQVIKGSATTTKVDKEYPDNKLSGAVFEVYSDTDNDKKFDAEKDTLVAEMTETDTGVYSLDNLVYGGYFMFEKEAPNGFVKDNEYHYFEVSKNEKAVTVENEAGVGFTNKPVKGKIEITKKDVSSGKLLPDTGFRIRDEKGNIVVEGYTDENGVATFELRSGKYTYEEFDAPDRYVIDTTPHSFEITEDGQIIKAEMTNQKEATPDQPQTGEESNMSLFVGLGAIALGAIVAVCIIKFKKKDEDDE